MTKAEIIEAINATIAPNNVKGITAESLANILIEIVNAAGEGGGGAEYLDMTMADQETGALTESAKAHNAEVFDKIDTAFRANAAPPSIVMTDSGLALYAHSIQANEDKYSMSFHTPIEDVATNVMVSATSMTGEGMQFLMGNDLLLTILELYPNGEVGIVIPGVM